MRLFIIFIVAIVTLTVDLSTKQWASHNLATHDDFTQHSFLVYAPCTHDRPPLTLLQLLKRRFPDANDEELQLLIYATTDTRAYPVLTDQLIKPCTAIAISDRSVTLLPRLITLKYTHNEGNAFGMFRSFDSKRRTLDDQFQTSLRRRLTSIGMALLVLLVAGVMFWLTNRINAPEDAQPIEKQEDHDTNTDGPQPTSTTKPVKKNNPIRLSDIGIALFVGGGVGNALDRWYTGYVIDFIKIIPLDIPVFNFADIFLTVGFVLILLGILATSLSQPKHATET